jgi:hypothetical protein
VVPQGHVRLHVWEHRPEERRFVYEQEAAEKALSDADKSAIFGLQKIGELTVLESATTHEMKHMILETLLRGRGDKSHAMAMEEQLRIRTMDSCKRVKGVLRNMSQTVKRCKLTNGANIAVEVQDMAEQMADSAVVLWLAQKMGEQEYTRHWAACNTSGGSNQIPTGGGGYGSPVQLLFDAGPFPRCTLLICHVT